MKLIGIVAQLFPNFLCSVTLYHRAALNDRLDTLPRALLLDYEKRPCKLGLKNWNLDQLLRIHRK